MRDKPFFSIVMPVYNDEKNIGNAINSILKQSYKNWELIIVDDCSTDKSYSIIKKFQRKNKKIISYKNKENSGNWYTRDFGTRKSKYKWIVNIDSDIIAPEKWLELAKNITKINVDIFGGGVRYTYDSKTYLNNLFHLSETIILPKSRRIYKKGKFFEEPCLGSANLFFKKSIFNRLGGFDRSLRAGGDRLFCSNVVERGYIAMYDPKIAVYHPLYNFRNLKDFFRRSIYFARTRNLLIKKSFLIGRPYKIIFPTIVIFLFLLITSLTLLGVKNSLVIFISLFITLSCFRGIYIKHQTKIKFNHIIGYLIIDLIKKSISTLIYIMDLKPKRIDWKNRINPAVLNETPKPQTSKKQNLNL